MKLGDVEVTTYAADVGTDAEDKKRVALRLLDDVGRELGGMDFNARTARMVGTALLEGAAEIDPPMTHGETGVGAPGDILG